MSVRSASLALAFYVVGGVAALLIGGDERANDILVWLLTIPVALGLLAIAWRKP